MARIVDLIGSGGDELLGLFFYISDLVHGCHKTTMIYYHEKNCMKGLVEAYINYDD